VLVLRILGEAEPASKVLGVTEKDLFIPMLSFVLGQEQLGGPAAVISWHAPPEVHGLSLTETFDHPR
jgi:predicted Zn-dependent protease